MARRAESRLMATRLSLVIALVALAATAAPAVRRQLLVPVQSGGLANELATGKLLVARRSLQDPNFAETVILLVEHSDDEGTVGLILNRQTKIPLSRLSKELEGAKGRTEPLFLGGPVQTEGVMALVRSRAKLEEAKHVLADIYMISKLCGVGRRTTGMGAWNGGLERDAGNYRCGVRSASRNAVVASGCAGRTADGAFQPKPVRDIDEYSLTPSFPDT